MAKFPMVIINETVPLILKLNPNPNSISIDRNKVYSKTQTLGGWVFEHWGDQPRLLRVRGRTKPVLGRGSPGANSTLGVEAALFALQTAYELDKRPLVSWLNIVKSLTTRSGISSGDAATYNKLKELSKTVIYYKFDFYSGFFTNFKYEQNAENMPRHYEYEFEFQITATAQSSLLNKILSSPFGGIGAVFAGAASAFGTSGNLLEGTTLLSGALAPNIPGVGGPIKSIFPSL